MGKYPRHFKVANLSGQIIDCDFYPWTNGRVKAGQLFLAHLNPTYEANFTHILTLVNDRKENENPVPSKLEEESPYGRLPLELMIIVIQTNISLAIDDEESRLRCIQDLACLAMTCSAWMELLNPIILDACYSQAYNLLPPWQGDRMALLGNRMSSGTWHKMFDKVRKQSIAALGEENIRDELKKEWPVWDTAAYAWLAYTGSDFDIMLSHMDQDQPMTRFNRRPISDMVRFRHDLKPLPFQSEFSKYWWNRTYDELDETDETGPWELASQQGRPQRLKEVILRSLDTNEYISAKRVNEALAGLTLEEDTIDSDFVMTLSLTWTDTKTLGMPSPEEFAFGRWAAHRIKVEPEYILSTRSASTWTDISHEMAELAKDFLTYVIEWDGMDDSTRPRDNWHDFIPFEYEYYRDLPRVKLNGKPWARGSAQDQRDDNDHVSASGRSSASANDAKGI